LSFCLGDVWLSPPAADRRRETERAYGGATAMTRTRINPHGEPGVRRSFTSSWHIPATVSGPGPHSAGAHRLKT
jgi:hypothetical protein